MNRKDQLSAGSVNAALVFGEAANFGAADVGTMDLTTSFTLPRLTTSERDALTAVNGMLIYNSTTNKFQGYENGSWSNLI
ncbi:MAG: hypothetical protein VW270_20435 [Candidatus Poseidoniales archaeon]|jgi:hypothetical protein